VSARLKRIRALREADPERYAEEIAALARQVPQDLEVQLEAAYGLDAQGLGDQAVPFYRRAYALGARDVELCFAFGSILRSEQDFETALAVVGQAVQENPDHASLRALLAVILSSAGHNRAAMATALEVILQLGAADDALDGYEPALAALQHELLSEIIGPTA
jgi:tetratricopeptide (TPR) repeat protein